MKKKLKWDEKPEWVKSYGDWLYWLETRIVPPITKKQLKKLNEVNDKFMKDHPAIGRALGK